MIPSWLQRLHAHERPKSASVHALLGRAKSARRSDRVYDCAEPVGDLADIESLLRESPAVASESLAPFGVVEKTLDGFDEALDVIDPDCISRVGAINDARGQ